MNSSPALVPAVTVDDSLGRPRQTQTQTPKGGRLISDTFYDSHGWVAKSDAPYYNTQGVPSSTLLTVADNQIPNETVTTYDGQGRATVSQFVSYGVNQWATATAYPGADAPAGTHRDTDGDGAGIPDGNPNEGMSEG